MPPFLEVPVRAGRAQPRRVLTFSLNTHSHTVFIGVVVNFRDRSMTNYGEAWLIFLLIFLIGLCSLMSIRAKGIA